MAATVRQFRPEDAARALEIFRAGLMQYAVEGSVVAHMEKRFFATKTAPGGDMHCIESFYSHRPDRAFFVAETGEQPICGICAAVLAEDGGSVELQVRANCPRPLGGRRGGCCPPGAPRCRAAHRTGSSMRCAAACAAGCGARPLLMWWPMASSGCLWLRKAGARASVARWSKRWLALHARKACPG